MSAERRCLAGVYVIGDPAAFAVAETQQEVLAAIDEARSEGGMARLTLANAQNPKWNGRDVFINPHHVTGVTPPLRQDEDEDEDGGS